MYASTAWVSASIPVAAVIRAGSVAVMAGSTRATWGKRRQEIRPILVPVSSL